MTNYLRLAFAGIAAALLVSRAASAAVIDITIGDQDFTDGTGVSAFAFNGASGGEPSPFDAFRGSDPAPGPNFAATWSYGYLLPPLDVIVSASIELGIVDHDSAQAGSQLLSFTVDGYGLTPDLDALFEGPGEGASGQYDVYFLPIPAAALTGFGDGAASFSLSLQGPGGGILGSTPNNGAGLDFARLQIETRPSGGSVPEPATAFLILFGVLGTSALRARRLRS